MFKNKRLFIGIIIVIILTIMVAYQYGYLSIKESIGLIKEEKEMKLKKLLKYKKILQNSKELENELIKLNKILKDEEVKLIPGKTYALACAKLQDNIKKLIKEGGGSVRSERMEKTSDYEGYKVITVSVDAEVSNIEALSNILYSIEASTPYMVIKELNIRVRNYRRPDRLIVRLKVAGLSK